MTDEQKQANQADAAAAAKKPAEKKSTAKSEAPAGVVLVRGEGDDQETVTAYKPSTVTQLKSQGWKVAE